jgi:hypothetical protein
MSQMNFVFSGDATKLQSAPAFSASQLSQGTFAQRIYSHFGLSSGSATGGALSPGGTSTGSGVGTGTDRDQYTPESSQGGSSSRGSSSTGGTSGGGSSSGGSSSGGSSSGGGSSGR